MTLWERFIQERVYLKGVSPATVRYYRWVERAFRPILDAPTKQGMMDSIASLLATKKVSPISVNTYLRGFKAYVLWLKAEGHLTEVFKVQFLKTEQKILATLSEEQSKRLIQYKPSGTNEVRAHAITLVLLDTGLRISECLSLTKKDLDFDNLIIRVKGKGGMHRLIPFSVELRKHLFRYIEKLAVNGKSNVAFATDSGTQVTLRNLQRDLKQLCRKAGVVGVRCSPHTLRHTFAVSYLRKGGNLFYLSRILGHTSVKTTERYLQSLGVEDLQKVHDGLSLLNAARGL